MSKYKPNMKDRYYQGQYIPVNFDKYVGDVSDIIYRSKWEYAVCWWCDHNESIIKWSSEPEFHKIPYDIIENGNIIRSIYIPDFWLKIKKTDGSEEEQVLEIKPYKQTLFPEEPKKYTEKSSQGYEYRLKMYQRNLVKWDTAKKYFEKKGILFYVLTEKYFDKSKIKLF